MAQVVSEFREYVGISNDTFVDGLHPIITVAIPEFNPLEKHDLGEIKVYKCCTKDDIAHTCGCANVQKCKTVVCQYFGNDGNHIYPCVHRGERVRVFNYAGTEQYYWKEWGRDVGLHKHERVRWYAMDKKDKGIHWSTDKKVGAMPTQTDEYNNDGGSCFTEEWTYSNVTDENTYFIEMNTKPGDKGVRIHTGVEDSEPYAYDISIWPESGVLEISDNASGGGCKNHKGNCPCHMDTGNNIRLNTKEHWWHIRNVDDSVIDIKKENITIACKDTISLVAGKNIVLTAGEDYTLAAPNQSITGTKRSTEMTETDTIVAPNQTRKGTNSTRTFTKGVDAFQDYGIYATNATANVVNTTVNGTNLTINEGTTIHTGQLYASPLQVFTGTISLNGVIASTGAMASTGSTALTGGNTMSGANAISGATSMSGTLNGNPIG